MAKFPPDERTVYLAFKNVFKGPDGNMRSDKKIKKKIQKHENGSDEIRALVHEHNIDNVGNSVKALLEGDIFASTLKAKMHFPELFDVSPAQSAERAASEAEAIRAEMDAMRDVSVAQQDHSMPQSAERAASEATAVKSETDAIRDVTVTQQKQGLPTAVNGKAVAQKEQPHVHVSHIQSQLKPETFGTRSSYPLYLPAKGQRRLLSKVQDILEHACFRFAEGTMTQELRKQGWDSSDCVELNCWMGMFRSRENLFDVERIATLSNLSANYSVQSLRFDIPQSIASRAELDRIEIAAWEAMLEEDKQYQCFAGMSLEEMVDVPETAFYSRANSEADETSEEETSVESESEAGFHCVTKEPQGPIAVHIVRPTVPSL
ncbi:hypothetical protein E8E11_002719 [Didymella keratinophila]|nr:hypothetical protein E8E11_002719 [Didymella keratinophila]